MGTAASNSPLLEAEVVGTVLVEASTGAMLHTDCAAMAQCRLSTVRVMHRDKEKSTFPLRALLENSRR